MKFSGKVWLMIILKATKKQAFTLSLENTFLEKTTGERGGGGSVTFLEAAICEKYFQITLMTGPCMKRNNELKGFKTNSVQYCPSYRNLPSDLQCKAKKLASI